MAVLHWFCGCAVHLFTILCGLRVTQNGVTLRPHQFWKSLKLCFAYCCFTVIFVHHCAEWRFSVLTLKFSLRRIHTSRICDITTNLEPIMVLYTSYTSVMWKLEGSSAHTLRTLILYILIYIVHMCVCVCVCVCVPHRHALFVVRCRLPPQEVL